MKKNRQNSEYYSWGNDCSGWHLVKSNDLSIIEEIMPPNTKEVKHYHSNSQQFFYILRGEATFEIVDQKLRVTEREGIHIKPEVAHQISNEESTDLEFLVISQPTTKGDRMELDQSSNT